MEEDYHILNEYVQNSSFESYLTPELFVTPYIGTSNLETSLCLEIKHSHGTDLFLASIIVFCMTKLDDGRTLFEFKLRYDILVALKQGLTDASIRKYLKTVIPQYAYPQIKEAIYIRTKDIGFTPIILDDYTFTENNVCIEQSNTDNRSPDTTNSYEQRIHFESLIEDIEKSKEGAEFLEVFRNSGGQLHKLNDFNLYICLFRFMKYVDFSVSSEVCLNLESKKLIYYIIAGSDECEWRLEKPLDSKIPNLIFNYKDSDEELHISKMTESELFELCTSLFVDLITKSAVNILLIESEIGSTISPKVTKFVTREDYRSAFEYQLLDTEQQAFVDSMYDKIAKTQVETFLYQ